MLEQRRYTRIKIRSMDIKCKMHYDTDIKLLNISFNGACVSLDKQLQIGNEYILHIESGGNTVAIKSVIVWERIVKMQKDSEKGDAVPTYEVGISFKDTLTEDGTNILDFIDRNIFLKQSRVRLRGIRVTVINPKTSTILGDHKSYSIIKLSLGGLLMEAEKLVEAEGKFMMEIDVPTQKQPLKFLGRVTSCTEIPGSLPKNFGVGIAFDEMSEKDRLKLKKFVDSLQES